MLSPKSVDAQRISKSLTYLFKDGPSPQIYNNTKIGCILQMQRKGKKYVTNNWQAALNFILIDLVENHR